MVAHPAEGCLEDGQVIGGGNLGGRLDGLKVCLCPVALAEPVEKENKLMVGQNTSLFFVGL